MASEDETPAAISVPFGKLPSAYTRYVRLDEEEDLRRLRETCRGDEYIQHFRGQTSRQDYDRTRAILRELPCGFTTIDVLPELCGLPVCDLVLGYLAALRPSAIRITGGEVHTDAMQWRVTVLVDKDDKVERIYQEVSIGFGCGYDMGNLLDEFKGGRPASAFSGGAIMDTAALSRADFE